LLFSTRHAIKQELTEADLVVGAVLLPGAKAPSLVTEEDLKTMKDGSVIVDVAVDQGGCVETIRPTTHDDPTYVVHGVVHYGVANMPGAVPRTSTAALTNATLPYAISLAGKGWRAACAQNAGLASGVNIVEGRVTCPGVADAFGMECRSLRDVMATPVTA
jgi:alanine dehydrogenase